MLLHVMLLRANEPAPFPITKFYGLNRFMKISRLEFRNTTY